MESTNDKKQQLKLLSCRGNGGNIMMKKILKTIANIILGCTCVIDFLVIVYMAGTFFFGYTDYGLLGMAEGTTYYNINAWLNDLKVLMICLPWAGISVVYKGLYFLVKRAAKNVVKPE